MDVIYLPYIILMCGKITDMINKIHIIYKILGKILQCFINKTRNFLVSLWNFYTKIICKINPTYSKTFITLKVKENLQYKSLIIVSFHTSRHGRSSYICCFSDENSFIDGFCVAENQYRAIFELKNFKISLNH